MSRVYIEHASQDYYDLFQELGYELVYSPDAADLVCFTGGSDVTPALYGDAQHRYTHNDRYRDAKEERLFKYLREHEIPMVGICRGGQFLNVMSGGRMYQHVTGHAGKDHYIVDAHTDEKVLVSSTHHQMMMPSKDGEVLAFAAITSHREWFEGKSPMSDISSNGIEVVWYENTKCLCFQPHPEFTDDKYQGMKNYFSFLLEERL